MIHPVPGVLLSNRPIDAANPALTDIAPPSLRNLDNTQAGQYDGHSVFIKSRPLRMVWFTNGFGRDGFSGAA